MAIIERPIPATDRARRRRRRRHPVDVARRASAGRSSTTGWRSWVFTVDHKKLGIMYGVSADGRSSSSAASRRC